MHRTQDELDDAVKTKPTTRIEACQLLATLKVGLKYCSFNLVKLYICSTFLLNWVIVLLYFNMLQGLKKEVEEKKLPEEIYEVDYEEDYEDVDYVDRAQLLRRLKNMNTSINDNIARVETLCVCWNKLNADMKELTAALR